MAAAKGQAATSPRKRVLVVDDDSFRQKITTTVLEFRGHAYEIAANGQQAVELAESRTFDLILMDVAMPVMDGLEATRIIRRREQQSGQHVPIVAMTGSINREPCLEAGMDVFIAKPIDTAELSSVLDRFISPVHLAEPHQKKPLDILLIEDSPTAAKVVEIYLQRALSIPCTVHWHNHLSDGLERLSAGDMGLVLLDLNLPDSEGIDSFLKTQERADKVPIVVLSGDADETLAVTAVRRGAQDYLVKGRMDEMALGRSVRFALERVKRHEAEEALRQTEEQLFVARAVQRELFPKNPPKMAGVDVFGKCEPADAIGGDYFDYIPMHDGCIGFVIADVSGHGIGAAFIMVATRAVLRSLTTTYRDVGYIVSCANRILADDLQYGAFITLMYVCIDPATKSLTYVGAGHQAFLLSRDGKVKTTLGPVAPPLNVFGDYLYPTVPAVAIESGDILLQVTDGITETQRRDGELFGDERLLDVVRKHRSMPARDIVEMIFHSTREFSQGRPQTDDLTAVVAKFT